MLLELMAFNHCRGNEGRTYFIKRLPDCAPTPGDYHVRVDCPREGVRNIHPGYSSWQKAAAAIIRMEEAE